MCLYVRKDRFSYNFAEQDIIIYKVLVCTNEQLFTPFRCTQVDINKLLSSTTPEIIEEKLSKLPYIKECIVTTRKQKNNTIILAKLYIDGDKSSLEKDIEKINAIFPKYMHIDDYEIMDTEFEKNSTKKIIRSKYVK